MKKLLFATALLAALLLSACGGKTNDDDFMNKPAVTPEPGMEIDPEFGVDPEPETDENAQPAPQERERGNPAYSVRQAEFPLSLYIILKRTFQKAIYMS